MEIPYEVTPRRDTGLFNSKLGIWLFLASEVMLFGGLFSAYVFLRVGVIEGVDTPWPCGLNVHKTFVVIGFVNTLVLIISSVFVVFGWIALKERKWGTFQIYMYLTVACAAIFMAFKTVEYRSKLTQHHDIKLTDNSVMEGKILDQTFDVPFEAKKVEFNLVGSSPGFIKDIDKDEQLKRVDQLHKKAKEDYDAAVVEANKEADPEKKEAALTVAKAKLDEANSIGWFPILTASWKQFEQGLSAGANSLALASIKGITVGEAVSGEGIAEGTTVKAISEKEPVVELSKASSAFIAHGANVTIGESSRKVEAANWVKVDREALIKSAKEFDAWFVKQRNKTTADLVRERKRYREELAVKERKLYAKEPLDVQPKGPNVDTKAMLTAAEPFKLHSRRRQVRPIQRLPEGDSMAYIDGSVIFGKGGDDRVKFEPHVVDMQLVPVHKQNDSMVWDVLGDDHLKQAWYKNRDAAYKEMEDYYAGINKEIPESMLRGYYINIQSLHVEEEHDDTLIKFFKEFGSEFMAGVGLGGHSHDKDHKGANADDHKDAKGYEVHPKEEAHQDPKTSPPGEGEVAHHEEHTVLMIPRDKIKFLNSHGPRNGNYYAIYFTMTALHGLHVVGGALVLLYFVVFGKPIYLKNPEHLANRVEVGGLFWHFVDLIWIFLFPLMYLL